MNRRVIAATLTAALAGLLFGFDTVVISGAEQRIQALWSLTPAVHGLTTASALYGTVLGALVASWPTDRWGRRPTLLVIGVLYVVSALWSAVAADITQFILARFLGGVGIGVSTVAAPLYISEIAPASQRGRLAGLFQFNIVFGIIVAYLSNSLLAPIGPDAWRWMLGVAAFPAALYTLCCLSIPESPRWLIGRRGDLIRAAAVLQLIHPQENETQLAARVDAIATASTGRAASPGSPTSSLRKPTSIAFLLAFFNQMSGINAVLYFAPRIFALAGLGEHAALLQSIGIGLTNLVFTLLGLWLIDRVGRRTLLYIGCVGYIVSLGLLATAFHRHYFSIVPGCLFAFIAAHAVGQGTVIWVYLSEIFPNRYRAQGQTLGSVTHWVFAALLTTFFPKLVGAFAPAGVFLFFCAMMVLQLAWVKAQVVETRGVPLEEIQQRLGLQAAPARD
jgi:sugar porter (SP) family MFS transporter